MTTRHPHLFNLESGPSGLGFYTTRGDVALKLSASTKEVAEVEEVA
jgi:hypothetical protein